MYKYIDRYIYSYFGGMYVRYICHIACYNLI